MDINNTQEQSGYIHSFDFQNFLISSSVWNGDPGCTLQQGSWLGAGLRREHQHCVPGDSCLFTAGLALCLHVTFV